MVGIVVVNGIDLILKFMMEIFVLQHVGLLDFEPFGQRLLKNKIKTDVDFLKWVINDDIIIEILMSCEYNRYVSEISSAKFVSKYSVLSRIYYGLRDYAIPTN